MACTRAGISKDISPPAHDRNGSKCMAIPISPISTAPTARTLQKRFFGHFLKGDDTGWEKERQNNLSLNIRRPGEQFTLRAENEWPLERTQWTRFYLDPRDHSLDREPAGAEATLSYHTRGEGLNSLRSR